MAFLIVLACIAVLVIDWLLAKEFYKAANSKGYYAKKYLWIAFLFTMIGYLLIIALPDRGTGESVGAKPASAAEDALPEL